MRDSKVHENRREEPPDFFMTNLRQAGFPTEMSVKKAVASDAEIIHLRLVGSEIGQQTDREGKQSATPASIDQLQPGRLERRPGAQHTALKVVGHAPKSVMPPQEIQGYRGSVMFKVYPFALPSSAGTPYPETFNLRDRQTFQVRLVLFQT